MAFRNSVLRYGTVAMTLHWLIATFILLNLGLGVTFNEVMDRHAEARFGVIQLHKSIGLTVLVLSLARLAWRLINPVPPLPADMSATKKFLAHATHFLLYFFIIAIPMLGWALVSASRTGIPTLYFGQIPWPNIWFIADLSRDQKIADSHLLSTAHIAMAYALAALAVLHVCAALYHHFHRRDSVLRRMVPGTDIGRHDTITERNI